MKKTYIEPKNTVVALNIRDNIMQAGSAPDKYNIVDPTSGPEITEGTDVGAREVIDIPDAWEEW